MKGNERNSQNYTPSQVWDLLRYSTDQAHGDLKIASFVQLPRSWTRPLESTAKEANAAVLRIEDVDPVQVLSQDDKVREFHELLGMVRRLVGKQHVRSF